MSFAQPAWLLLLAAAPAAAALVWRAHRRRQDSLRRFAGTKPLYAFLPAGGGRAVAATAAVGLAAGCIAVATAGPLLGHGRDGKPAGPDVVLVLDCSRSMLATDVLPDRLSRSKAVGLELLAQLPGSRAGLVAFAGTAFLHCPLTEDREALAGLLREIVPDDLPVGGSDPAAAFEVARSAFPPGGGRGRAVVLITDGEPTGGEIPGGVLEALRRDGIALAVLGVGTAAGAPVPARNGGFVRDAGGDIVLTRLAEPRLRSWAAAARGSFLLDAGEDREVAARIAAQVRRAVSGTGGRGEERHGAADRYRWPLLAALLSLLAAELAPLLPAASRKGVLILVLLGLGHGVCACPAPAVDGAVLEKVGNDRYAAGDYAGAVSAFRAALATSPQSSRMAYNLGNALYRIGDFEAAAASYEAALSGAPPKLRTKTLFNLGNAAYRLRRLEEAARRYDEALRLDPEDRDARANLAFTAQRLMEKRTAAAAAAGMPTAAATGARPASGSPGGGASGGRASGSGGSRSRGAIAGAPTGAAAVVPGREGPALRSEPSGSEPRERRRWALEVLEHVKDRAGSVRLPAYGRRTVEKDW